jgi:hypothetical protein
LECQSFLVPKPGKKIPVKKAAAVKGATLPTVWRVQIEILLSVSIAAKLQDSQTEEHQERQNELKEIAKDLRL